mmetsp:Transcript_68454/g.216643  ORF Transcript_68454/g.216643 Transcript_68454/m.216643 type:complete len:241 (+) Transcript_68454:1612-2334(+)
MNHVVYRHESLLLNPLFIASRGGVGVADIGRLLVESKHARLGSLGRRLHRSLVGSIETSGSTLKRVEERRKAVPRPPGRVHGALGGRDGACRCAGTVHGASVLQPLPIHARLQRIQSEPASGHGKPARCRGPRDGPKRYVSTPRSPAISGRAVALRLCAVLLAPCLQGEPGCRRVCQGVCVGWQRAGKVPLEESAPPLLLGRSTGPTPARSERTGTCIQCGTFEAALGPGGGLVCLHRDG